MDELFETLTLIQTGRMEAVPVILFGAEFWHKIINFEDAAFGTISPEDLGLISFVENGRRSMADYCRPLRA